ncbi:MAG TPA: MmcQ/YjbR family DNA-binding protein [Beutenbergiaceae bacterium]|nr:MmcQ/YjbR family DNA-binding protein [Beutenbergiaceae bacterium]
MATWDDVDRIASDLPEVYQRRGEERAWRVHHSLFVFERPLRRSDHAALGAAAPTGPILAAWVPDLGVKEALLADAPHIYFTTPHFDGYRIVLSRLGQVSEDELVELVTEAWLTRAPRRLGRRFEQQLDS